MRQLFFSVIISIFFLSFSWAQKDADNKNWYEPLPDCPCKNPDRDSIRLNDGWAREARKDEMSRLRKFIAGNKDFTRYHPGAVASFRSYPFVLTFIDRKKHHSGQQCTYDEKGNLIKSGAAAGTPDKTSPACGENRKGTLRVNIFRVFGHLKNDVKPGKKISSDEYNKLWVPNEGVNCQ